MPPQFTALHKTFFIKDFSSKSDQIRKKLRIYLKKSLKENFIFCAVTTLQTYGKTYKWTVINAFMCVPENISWSKIEKSCALVVSIHSNCFTEN